MKHRTKHVSSRGCSVSPHPVHGEPLHLRATLPTRMNEINGFDSSYRPHPRDESLPWHDSGGHPEHHRAPRGHHAVRCSVGRCRRPRCGERYGERGCRRHGRFGRAGIQDGRESGPVPLVRQRPENSQDAVISLGVIRQPLQCWQSSGYCCDVHTNNCIRWKQGPARPTTVGRWHGEIPSREKDYWPIRNQRRRCRPIRKLRARNAFLSGVDRLV